MGENLCFSPSVSRRGGRAPNDRCYISALRTDMFFMNGSSRPPSQEREFSRQLVTNEALLWCKLQRSADVLRHTCTFHQNPPCRGNRRCRWWKPLFVRTKRLQWRCWQKRVCVCVRAIRDRLFIRVDVFIILHELSALRTEASRPACPGIGRWWKMRYTNTEARLMWGYAFKLGSVSIKRALWIVGCIFTESGYSHWTLSAILWCYISTALQKNRRRC